MPSTSCGRPRLSPGWRARRISPGSSTPGVTGMPPRAPATPPHGDRRAQKPLVPMIPLRYPAGAMTSVDMNVLEGKVARRRQEFLHVAPFPHVVLDDFLRPDVARALVAEFALPLK